MTASNAHPAAPKTAPADASGYVPMRIRLADLGVDPKNARRTLAKAPIEALAKTMVDEQGRPNLLNRLTVYLNPDPKGPKFLVSAGQRRRAAALLLKWEEVDVNLAPAGTTTKRLAVNSLVENLQRESLTEFEQAMGYRQLAVDEKMTGADIARATGVSASHINNLMFIAEHLAPEVLKQWEAGHKLATFDTVRKIASIKRKDGDEMVDDHPAQLAAWEAECKGTRGLTTTAAPGQAAVQNGNSGRAARGQGIRAISKNLTQAIEYAKSKASEATLGDKRDFAISLLNYIVGQRKSPPEGFVFPEKAKKAGKKGKKTPKDGGDK